MLNRKKKRSPTTDTTLQQSSYQSEIPQLDGSNFESSNDANTMTRKPIRIRRPRNPFLQSGYCAICNLPYNSVEEHVQSKKHQKLIGEDANFIALNDYLHCDVGIESLLNLTGIDAIGFDNFALRKIKRRNMPRTKSSLGVTKSSATIENNKPRLRSRKNIKYVSPPPDVEEKFEEKSPLEPVRIQYKEYRELRSSTRALAKLTSIQNTVTEEVWDSGRPKRACINKSKRLSSDESHITEKKPLCKVELPSNKIKSTGNKDKESLKLSAGKTYDDDDNNVKFRKLRNSELIQLNNEATNFLFPKREESSDEEETKSVKEAPQENDKKVRDKKPEKEKKVSDKKKNTVPEEVKPSVKFKVEEEGSMDSISCEVKKKKKRRSHAEAFIMDNQKYYKFETPCSSNSRLRYHGSYLSPIPTKSNGDCVTTKTEKKTVAVVEKEAKVVEKPKSECDEYKFSFEMVPVNESWYKTFQRHDRSEERYNFSHNYYWDDFVLPSQIPHLKPLDPKICIHAYKTLRSELQRIHKEKQAIKEKQVDITPNECNSGIVDTSDSVVLQTQEERQAKNEDTLKTAVSSEPDVSNNTDVKNNSCERRKLGRKKKGLSSPPALSATRNPRKSPRQHASTLAILSSLTHQRKRRAKTAALNDTNTSLQTIPEESSIENKKTAVAMITGAAAAVAASPPKVKKKKEDYFALAVQIDEHLSQDIDNILDDFDLEPNVDPDFLRLKESRLNVDDIMTLYEQSKITQSCERMQRKSANLPGRKPGKRKKNKTGWPNKVKRKKVSKDESSDCVRLESDVENEHDDSDSIIDGDGNHNHEKNKVDCDLVDNNTTDRVETNSEITDNKKKKPHVFLKNKVNATSVNRSNKTRTVAKTQGQNKTTSPRALRKPRGRWYRER